MITVPKRIVDSGPPLRNDEPSSKAVRKVVVMQVKSRLGSDTRSIEDSGVYRENEIYDPARSAGQVLGTRVVDVKDGRVEFWFIKRNAGKNLGFELSFLQGAAAAIVLMELSDRETIQETKELLRDICKVFPIPVMLVVGGNIGEDLISWETPVGLGEIASKVVSFIHAGRKTAIPAS